MKNSPISNSVISQKKECVEIIVGRGIYVLVHVKRVNGSILLVRSVGDEEKVASIVNELIADSEDSTMCYDSWNEGLLVILAVGEVRYLPVHEGRVSVEYDDPSVIPREINVNCLLDAAADMERQRSFD